MEYLYLIIFCAFFSVQFVFRKYFEHLSDGTFAAGLWCSLFSSLAMLAYLLPAGGFQIGISSSALICSAAYTVSSVATAVVSLFAMKSGKLSVVTTYTLIGGFFLPFFWGVIAYSEEVTALKIIGMILLIAAIIGALFVERKTQKSDDGKTGFSFRFHGLCMILFAANGIISIATTASQKAADAVSSDSFLLLCLAENAVISLLFLLILGLSGQLRGNKNGIKNVFWEIGAKKPMTVGIFFLMILMCALYAACNGFGNIFSLNCAQTMDASIQFPLSSAVMILMSTAVGFIFFREKPDKSDLLRLALAAAGTVCFIL